jgi:hypothetical protein
VSQLNELISELIHGHPFLLERNELLLYLHDTNRYVVAPEVSGKLIPVIVSGVACMGGDVSIPPC